MNGYVPIFWAGLGVAWYAYVGYPLVLALLTWRWGRPVRRGPFRGAVSIVMAVRDGGGCVARRRDALLAELDRAGLDGELIIVSDGSTDETVVRARDGAHERVRVIDMQQSVGKAACLNAGVAAAHGDAIVFADLRQRWADDATARLVENFADPAVGGVSGDLCIETNGGGAAGVGLYWKLEKAIRRRESRLWSTVGATGAISAVRRSLYRPIPPGTVLDDVDWPLQVVRQGFRVVHDERAVAFDRLPDRSADEFRRKVRTLSGNFQLMARRPALLVPALNPVWWQFVSHKCLRLVVPWCLLGMLVASAIADGSVYRRALLAQLAAYALATIGIIWPRAARVSSAAAAFLLLNAAAWMAFWVWASGRSGRSWRTVRYSPVVVPAAGPMPAEV